MSYIERLESTELQYQDLSGLDFRGANMQQCSFAGADLHGAIFDGASGEMLDELAALRERESEFNQAQADEASYIKQIEDLQESVTSLTEERDEARESLADARARLADHDRNENDARRAGIEAALAAIDALDNGQPCGLAAYAKSDGRDQARGAVAALLAEVAP